MSFNKAIKTRLLGNFLRKMSTEALVPFFTIFLSLSYGSFFAGLSAFIILVTGVIANIYGGILATKLSCYKILIYGECIHTLTLFSMFFFLTADKYLLITLYLIKGIIFSILIPAGENIIYTKSQGDERKLVYQFNFWLNNVATPVGITIGAFLFNYQLSYVVLFSSCLALINFLVYRSGFCAAKNESIDNPVVNKKVSLRDYQRIIHNTPATCIIISAVLLYGVEFSFLQYFPVWLAKNNISAFFFHYSLSAGEIFAWGRNINSVVIVIFSLLMIKKIHIINNINALIISILLFTAAFISLFFCADKIIIYTLCVTLMSLMEIIYSPYRQSVFASKVEAEISGIYFSAWSLTARGGNIIAAIILMISDVIADKLIIALFILLGVCSAYLMRQKNSE